MRSLIIVLAVFLAGCGWIFGSNELDLRYGAPDPARFDSPVEIGQVNFQSQVDPILQKRCVVCHACYDAACQLKLDSYEGITRGLSQQRVYNATRLVAAHPTRLFEDAQTNAQWRDLGFSPVLNERRNIPAANIAGSVLAQSLLLKQLNPLPASQTLPPDFDLRLNRDQQCVAVEDFEGFAQQYPLWGMPYGLPALGQDENDTLIRWVAEGAPYQPAVSRITDDLRSQIESWELFLNQGSLKGRLMARYMYEHLFAAHLHFTSNDAPVFFRLVRSATAPGLPPQLISTRLPYSDPGVERVYYRFEEVRETIVVKSHMPYRLDPARMEKWQAWFLDTEYAVDHLPDYASETASNPFLTFEQIPANIRYKFLLEEAQFTIMGFIKGPVCRGQAALNVINDYFWVVFTDPDKSFGGYRTQGVAEALKTTTLPAASNSNLLPSDWLRYAEHESLYLEAKFEFLNASNSVPLNLDLLWDGDGNNTNASLTIYRHFDSASVVKGLQGKTPQTAWVIGYPLLERIHYLLVAGYDVFGNVGHQLNTRVYMDFLRIEGEANFLSLLPMAAREQTRSSWYRGDISVIEQHLQIHEYGLTRDTEIQFSSDDPLTELYAMFRQELADVQPAYHESAAEIDPDDLGWLETLGDIAGTSLASLPETSYVMVEESAGKQNWFFTILHHNAYTNVSHIFGNEDRRLPAEDRLSVVPGFVGAYPNQFFVVPATQKEAFANALVSLLSDEDYRQLLDDFGIRRSSPRFWQVSDIIQEATLETDPIAGGMFDYNRLENR